MTLRDIFRLLCVHAIFMYKTGMVFPNDVKLLWHFHGVISAI